MYFDVIVCCGGDGTLTHLVGALAKLRKRIPILYIPSGTTNDFARTLRLPNQLDDLIPLINRGKKFVYDIGKLNQSYFNYVAAFGAFTEVSYSTDQNFKNTFGYAAYLLQSIISLPNSLNERFHLTIEAEEFKGKGEYIFGAISNTTSVAGMSSPYLEAASLNDGQFEVLLVKAPDNLGELVQIASTLSAGATDNQYIHVFHTKHLKIRSTKPFAWTTDGEYGGTYTSVNIKVLNKRSIILVPEDNPQ